MSFRFLERLAMLPSKLSDAIKEVGTSTKRPSLAEVYAQREFLKQVYGSACIMRTDWSIARSLTFLK